MLAAAEAELRDGLGDARVGGVAVVVQHDERARREPRLPRAELGDGRVAVVRGVDEQQLDVDAARLVAGGGDELEPLARAARQQRR